MQTTIEVTRIPLPERFDVHEVDRFLTRLHGVEPRAGDVVAVDASDVRFLDEAGIEALTEVQHWCSTRGALVKLTNPSTCARITLELAQRDDAATVSMSAPAHRVAA